MWGDPSVAGRGYRRRPVDKTPFSYEALIKAIREAFLTSTIRRGSSSTRGALAAVRTLVRRAHMLTRALRRLVVFVFKGIYLVTAVGVLAALGFSLLTVTAGSLAADVLGGSRAADPGYREGVANVTTLFLVAGASLLWGARALARDPKSPMRRARERAHSAAEGLTAFRREWDAAAQPQSSAARAGDDGGHRKPPTSKRSGPLTGRRMWLVGPEDGHTGSAVLIAPVARAPWVGRYMEASCDEALRSRLIRERAGMLHDEPPPVLECTCGIYALKRAGWLVPRHRSPLVAGRIALTGKVIEGSRGYRAQRAEIVGPLRVTLVCAGSVEKGLWTRRSGTGWQPVRPRPCPFGATTLAVGSDEYVGLCRMHSAQAEDVLEGVPLLTPLGLQAQLELRYGVEVEIDERVGRWI